MNDIMVVRRKNFGTPERIKTVNCSCGGKAKLCSRKNYPFGKKSGAKTSWYYKCSSCNKNVFPNDNKGGKK